MKAVQISRYGDVSVLTVTDTVPKPRAGEGEVLVEVRAASINPVDSAVRQGFMQKMVPLAFPATLGTDLAGVVVVVGPGVTGLGVGDEVFGTASVLGGASGAFAQYAAVPSGTLGRLPSGLSFQEAAALPLAAVSALEGIDEKLKVDKGHRILIHGGAGGIGTIAIQLAKHRGAFVATTARADAVEYVRSLGADKVIDFEREPFEKAGSGYDCVFDTVGGETYRRSFAVLKRGGTVVSMLEQPDARLAEEHGVAAFFEMTQVNTARLAAVAGLVQDKVLRVHVDRVFPFEQVKEAFLAREAGRVRGKIVMSLGS